MWGEGGDVGGGGEGDGGEGGVGGGVRCEVRVGWCWERLKGGLEMRWDFVKCWMLNIMKEICGGLVDHGK